MDLTIPSLKGYLGPDLWDTDDFVILSYKGN